MIDVISIAEAQAKYPGKVPAERTVKRLSKQGRWPRLYRVPGLPPQFREDELEAFFANSFGGAR
jgi:hypothetical protein